MTIGRHLFDLAPASPQAIVDTYNYKIVALSYVIAVLGSYIALLIIGRLREEKNERAKVYWLIGGAFTIGIGIWSMHFNSILTALLHRPPENSTVLLTLSLFTAILASGLTLWVLSDQKRTVSQLILGGIFIGVAIASMHYLGMIAMKSDISVRYTPGLFLLSILMAISASEAALWLALKCNEGPKNIQRFIKIMTSLVMGVTLCCMHYTMHYTGMNAGISLALETVAGEPLSVLNQTLQPDFLAIVIASISGLVILLALLISLYHQSMMRVIQDEKKFLDAILNNLEDGIIACDRHGHITVINDIVRKTFDIPALDHSFENYLKNIALYAVNSETKLQVKEYPLMRALHGEHIQAMEISLVYNDTPPRHFLINGQPIINHHGDKTGAVVTLHDITDTKKNEQLKREFVSVVSHELRTPLTSIRGSIGLLMSDTMGPFNDKAKKLLGIASNNCSRLLLLINDILDMEKIQSGKMQFDLKVINITHIVEKSLIDNQLYGEQFTVKFELLETVDNLSVYVDPDRLLQVLANLLSNAAKFSPKGATVTINIQRIHKNKVCVSISDQGDGIPLEFQPRIFQKFSQANSAEVRNKNGTGLGLSISKAIIEKFEGSIGYTTAINQGTTFYFELPIYSA